MTIDTSKLAGLALAGSHPNPHKADLLSAVLIRDDTDELLQVSAHADRVDSRVYSRFPSLAAYRFEDIDITSQEAASEIIDEIHDVWNAGGTLAVWSAPIALGTLATIDPGFTVDGPVLDVQLLDRYLLPMRKGRRNVYTLAGHLLPDWTPVEPSLEDEAGAIIDTAASLVRTYPELQGDAQQVMQFQTQWAKVNADSLRMWLRKQAKTANRIDDGWPIRG